MTTLYGCTIETIDNAASEAWLGFVQGSASAPAEVGEPSWALCHCDDGVTWGRYEGGVWRLGSTAYPDLCPAPASENLQELRIFWREAEVLIWRVDGELCGRLLRDSNNSEPRTGEVPPDAPDTEERPLLGHRVTDEGAGFARVTDGAGSEQAITLSNDSEPSSRSTLLCVRHYFSRDERTGCVRIAASRLVEVK